MKSWEPALPSLSKQRVNYAALNDVNELTNMLIAHMYAIMHRLRYGRLSAITARGALDVYLYTLPMYSILH